MGRRSGDDKAIPMCDPEHRALHENGNELEWLAMHNIHGMALAASLWGCSGNVEQALDILAGLNDGD